MKKFLISVITLFVCVVCYGATFNQYWYIEDNAPIQTTCTTGGDIILPTPPTKYGYDFIGWEKVSFTRIEYLESTGTQYIDTEYIPNANTHYKWKAVDYTISDATLFGAENGSGTSCLLYGNKNRRTLFAGSTNTGTQYLSTGETPIEWQLICNAGTVILKKDGTQINFFNYGGTTSIDTIYIYGNHYNGRIGTRSVLKLYYFQIYDNDVLVRDFIPVLDQSGVPCMFDMVEGKFYYNAGTGDFIAGPVIGSGE